MSKTDMESFTLISSAGTGYFYVNRKNKKKGKGEKKLAVKKYDPIARKHVLFEEKKLSRAKKAKGGKKPAVEAATTEAKEAKKEVKKEVKKEASAKNA
jgi:large subunit ribosomal protein L33